MEHFVLVKIEFINDEKLFGKTTIYEENVKW